MAESSENLHLNFFTQILDLEHVRHGLIFKEPLGYYLGLKTALPLLLVSQ